MGFQMDHSRRIASWEGRDQTGATRDGSLLINIYRIASLVVRVNRHEMATIRQLRSARQLDIEGLDEFRETKHVHWDFNLEDKSYWYPYEMQ